MLKIKNDTVAIAIYAVGMLLSYSCVDNKEEHANICYNFTLISPVL